MGTDYLTFGIKTTPQHVDYPDLLDVWEEADADPRFSDAWIWDHLLPLTGPREGPALEAWTLLTSLAARTSRIRLGALVLSNRLRPPALLGKMAATLDVLAAGRLIMGLGVGGTEQPLGAGGIRGPNPARSEYDAFGYELVTPGTGIRMLEETVRLLRTMWNEPGYSFSGEFTTVRDGVNRPAPVQPGGPPILIGGWGNRLLGVAARHADVWNIPGPPHRSVGEAIERSHRLDELAAAADRDPRGISRSVQVVVDPAHPASSLVDVRALVDGGFDHIVLGLRRPFGRGTAGHVADALIDPVADGL